MLDKAKMRAHPPDMQLSAAAIVCAVRPHGEAGAIVRALTPGNGLLAGYVQGARSRTLRPVLIPGNEIAGVWRARVAGQLPSLAADPLHSRAHLLTEPLAAAGIGWAAALVASALPEAHPYPRLFEAMQGLLGAIEAAPAARGWSAPLVRFEQLLLAELGYGRAQPPDPGQGWETILPALDANGTALGAHIFAGQRTDVLAARERLIARLKRAGV